MSETDGIEKNEVLAVAEVTKKSPSLLRELGRKSLVGAALGLGFMVPVLGGGVLFANFVRGEADTLINDKIARAENTGNGWIITFRKENTDVLAPEVRGVKDTSCMIAQRLPGTQVSPQPNNSTTTVAVNEACPDINAAQVPAPNQEAAAPTTLPPEVVTTLSPDLEGDAAP